MPLAIIKSMSTMNKWSVAMVEALLWGLSIGAIAVHASAPQVAWTSPNRFRILLSVDGGGRVRTFSPAAVEVDFQSLLSGRGQLDDQSIEVMAIDETGRPKVFDGTRHGNDRWLVPHRLDRLFGSPKSTLHFVMRDQASTQCAVYFDTIESRTDSRSGQFRRYPGIVGDGDRFCEGWQRREIQASQFDQFVDFDGDGDLVLFKGGVEPHVECYENVGSNRLVARGRLASGGQLFTLPRSRDNRNTSAKSRRPPIANADQTIGSVAASSWVT